jgi:uncharacterized protein (DUF302 family)
MYHFTTVLETSFDNAIARVTEALKQEGMGVLTEIDVQAALKKKIGADFHPYKILGACQPQIAYQMLQIDDKAGTLYPCNVVVQQQAENRIEVSAIDPRAMFQDIHHPDAQRIALQASEMMQNVMNRLKSTNAVG